MVRITRPLRAFSGIVILAAMLPQMWRRHGGVGWCRRTARLAAAILAAGCSTGRPSPTPMVLVRGHSVVPDLMLYTLSLATLSDSSCALGWISERALCSTLSGYAVRSPYAHMRTYDSVLEAARSSVNDNAYALLKSNALIILNAIDTSAIAIRATCRSRSSRYVITNGSYTPVAVSYRLNGAAAKSIKLPGISSDYRRPGSSSPSAIRYSHSGGHLDVYFRDQFITSAQC